MSAFLAFKGTLQPLPMSSIDGLTGYFPEGKVFAYGSTRKPKAVRKNHIWGTDMTKIKNIRELFNSKWTFCFGDYALNQIFD